jgi:hypothetical protein
MQLCVSNPKIHTLTLKSAVDTLLIHINLIYVLTTHPFICRSSHPLLGLPSDRLPGSACSAVLCACLFPQLAQQLLKFLRRRFALVLKYDPKIVQNSNFKTQHERLTWAGSN